MIIARVRLRENNVSFYDKLSNIRLTIENPESDIYDNYNITTIKKAIKNNILYIVSGNIELDDEEDTNIIDDTTISKKKTWSSDNINKKIADASIDTLTDEQLESLKEKIELSEEDNVEAYETW